MQDESGHSIKISKLQPIFSDENMTIASMLTKTINDFVDHPSRWKTTATVTRQERVTQISIL